MQSLVIGVTSVLLGVLLLLPLIWVLVAVFLRATRGDGSLKAKKQRHKFANKGLCSQSYVFSSSHV